MQGGRDHNFKFLDMQMKINLPPVSSTTEPAVHCSFRPTIMGFKRVQKIISYFDVVRGYRIALWDSSLGTNFNPFPCATLQQRLFGVITSLKYSHSAICENTDTVPRAFSNQPIITSKGQKSWLAWVFQTIFKPFASNLNGKN